MAPAYKSSSKWKELKKIVVGQTAIKSLKSLDPKSLKTFRNAQGKNLLHVTAKRAFLDISKYLIKAGVDMNLEEKKNGHTPLSYALSCSDKKRKKIVDLLVRSGADVSWNKIKRHSGIFKDPKIAANFFCALKSREGSSKGSYQSVADHLLSRGWSLDNIACLQNEIVTKCALSKDNSLKENFKKLIAAISQQDVLRVKQILQLVYHSKRILSWALMEATRIRSPQSTIIIKLLLDYGAPVDGFADDMKSPLVEALINRNVENSWVILDHESVSKRDKLDEQIKQFHYYPNPWIPEEEREKERVLAKNCIRLLIEHRGICSCEDLRSGFPNRLRNYYNNFIYGLCIKNSLCKDYAFLQCHLTEKNYSDIDNNSSRLRSVELERLKNYKVKNCPDFWNILTKTIDEVVPLTRNESFIRNIKEKSFIDMFPHYGSALQFKVHKAVQKRLLIDSSIEVLRKCLPPCINSCYLILEKIICYMGVPNLLCFEETKFKKRL